MLEPADTVVRVRSGVAMRVRPDLNGGPAPPVSKSTNVVRATAELDASGQKSVNHRFPLVCRRFSTLLPLWRARTSARVAS